MGGFRRAGRLDGIELSEIVQISERAARLKVEGRDILSLSTGEPDMPTPPHVVEAAHRAAREGRTTYPPTAGIGDLRAAVAALYGVGAAQAVVSTGAKQVIANAMLATLDSGDEVIMPAPYWTSYADIVRMCGGVPVVVPCAMAQGFRLTPDQLAAAITPRTRWLMLNSPSNPSGAIYGRAEIAALAAVLDRHPHVWLLSDEIYEHLSFVPFTSAAEAAPGLRDRTLIVNGASKAWSMTGWRLGWGVGPLELIGAMIAAQGQVTSGACSIAQWAALAALQGDPAILDERRAILDARRRLVVAALNAIPGMTCPEPDGAFYAFPSVTGLLKAGGGRFEDDADLCAWLMETAGVAVVPGRAFGLPGHLRLSFAYGDATLREGIARITEALEGVPA